jgi:hypothetical protein
MFDGNGEEGHVFSSGAPFRIVLRYLAHEACRQPVFGVGIYRSDGTYINGSNHHWREHPIELEEVAAGEEGEVEMRFDAMPVLEGRYYVTTFLYDHGKPAPTAIDHREHAVTFEVVDPRHHQHGLLYLPTVWSIRRSTPDGGTDERESPS